MQTAMALMALCSSCKAMTMQRRLLRGHANLQRTEAMRGQHVGARVHLQKGRQVSGAARSDECLPAQRAEAVGTTLDSRRRCMLPYSCPCIPCRWTCAQRAEAVGAPLDSRHRCMLEVIWHLHCLSSRGADPLKQAPFDSSNMSLQPATSPLCMCIAPFLKVQTPPRAGPECICLQPHILVT